MQKDQWGYFRPGYFPIQEDSIVPAMICLNNTETVQFILVKTDCYLKIWEDALFISETDFEMAQKNSPDDITDLMTTFMDRGYLPLQKINPDISFLAMQ